MNDRHVTGDRKGTPPTEVLSGGGGRRRAFGWVLPLVVATGGCRLLAGFEASYELLADGGSPPPGSTGSDGGTTAHGGKDAPGSPEEGYRGDGEAGLDAGPPLDGAPTDDPLDGASDGAALGDASDGGPLTDAAVYRGDGGPWGCVGFPLRDPAPTDQAKAAIVLQATNGDLYPSTQFRPVDTKPFEIVACIPSPDAPPCGGAGTTVLASTTMPTDGGTSVPMEVPYHQPLTFRVVSKVGWGILSSNFKVDTYLKDGDRLYLPVFPGLMDSIGITQGYKSTPRDKAIVVVRLADCRLNFLKGAGGIRFELEGVANPIVRYFSSDAAAEPNASATSDNGYAIFSYVVPGEVRVSAFRGDTRVGQGSIVATAGEYSVLYMVPLATTP